MFIKTETYSTSRCSDMTCDFLFKINCFFGLFLPIMPKLDWNQPVFFLFNVYKNSNDNLPIHEQADTANQMLTAFALICLWCHLFALSHLWLADWLSICSVSWLVLLAQGGGLSKALWIMTGCPDNPCNVDSVLESNMAVLWQRSLKWRTRFP